MGNNSMHRASGLTIIELMVVIGIIAALAVIAVPTIIQTLPGRNLNSSATDLVSSFRRVRSLAIKNNSPVTIGPFDPTDAPQTYKVAGAFPPKKLDSGINFGYPGRSTRWKFKNTAGADAGDSVIFNAIGLAVDSSANQVTGYVYLQNSKGEGYRIGVQGLGANIIKDKCGVGCLKNDGTPGTLHCESDPTDADPKADCQ